MRRSNEQWLAQLSADGAEQHAALSDLREALLRGLRSGLGSQRVDEGVLEDAVQDALTRILDRLTQFEGRSHFVTWATSIAIRLTLTELRRHHWKDVSLDDLTSGVGLTSRAAAETDSQATRWEQTELVHKMHEIIRDELTDKQRTALLAELKGMPQDEIARQLGSNRNAIYKLAHDARKRLKRGLETAGYRAKDIRSAFAG